MVEIKHVTVDQIVDLRRRVLRADDETAEVIVAGDHVEGCFHLGVVDAEEVIACVSAFVEKCPDVESANAWQFRFLAVTEQRQGEGLGRMLMAELLVQLRARGVDVVWANGRDTAQGFYEAMRFTIVHGSAHRSPSTDLPHHRIFVLLNGGQGQ